MAEQLPAYVRESEDALGWLMTLDRCPPGCIRCAVEYLDAQEEAEASALDTTEPQE